MFFWEILIFFVVVLFCFIFLLSIFDIFFKCWYFWWVLWVLYNFKNILFNVFRVRDWYIDRNFVIKFFYGSLFIGNLFIGNLVLFIKVLNDVEEVLYLYNLISFFWRDFLSFLLMYFLKLLFIKMF